MPIAEVFITRLAKFSKLRKSNVYYPSILISNLASNPGNPCTENFAFFKILISGSMMKL